MNFIIVDIENTVKMDQDVSSQIRDILRQQVESWNHAGLTHIAKSEAIFESKIPVQEEVEVQEVKKTSAPKEAAPRTSVQETTKSEDSVDPVKQFKPFIKTSPVQNANTASNELEANMKKTVKRAEPRTTKNKMSLKKKTEALEVLSKRVAKCKRCKELASTRTQTVFGIGDPNARIMFIGEAPGAEEDELGVPFVGRSGRLLTSIIEACNLTREDIYICNILRCRPPGNRNPSTEEANSCREFLDEQISIVDPDYIVCWGSVAAKNLLDEKTPIGKMRGQFFDYGRAKVLCTYHPAYMLRNPPSKKDVWIDLQFLFKDMGIKLK